MCYAVSRLHMNTDSRTICKELSKVLLSSLHPPCACRAHSHPQSNSSKTLWGFLPPKQRLQPRCILSHPQGHEKEVVQTQEPCRIPHQQNLPALRNWKRLRDMENRLVAAKAGWGWSGMDGEFGVGRCKGSHFEWISSAVLLYSTGNYIHSLKIEHDGRWYEKKKVYICMTGSLCCTAEIDTTL